MKNKTKKIIIGCLSVIVSLILIVMIFFQLSPIPGAYLIGRLFDSPVAMTDEVAYKVAKKEVGVHLDEVYESAHKDNTYDIYYPKNGDIAVPVLIWAHGGGFVGGDKSGVKEFATKIVSDAHVAIVALNYQPAPGSQYPNQVRQLNEVVKELQQKQIKGLDLSTIYFGGDSAGAQIALQYATVQSNPDYAKEMGMKQLVDRKTIKGVISYCGPVNLRQMSEIKLDSLTMNFFINTVAWSLIGTKHWQNDPKLFQASLVDHVTKEFPPLYITDGNAFSFQEQGQSLKKRLTELDVPVQGLFYDKVTKEITHEYQFNYATKEAQECYDQTIRFLAQYR